RCHFRRCPVCKGWAPCRSPSLDHAAVAHLFWSVSRERNMNGEGEAAARRPTCAGEQLDLLHNPGGLSDESLVALCLDPGLPPRLHKMALERLVRRFREQVLQLAHKIVRGDGEDVAQDLMVQLQSILERYDPAKGKLRAFLNSCVFNLALGTVRKERKRRQLLRQRAAYLAGKIVPDHAAAGLEAEEAVALMLGALRGGDRDLFRQHYLEGQAVKDIARAKGIPPGQVYR